MVSAVGDGAGTTSEDAGEERAESPVSAVAAKRRRMTVSMESVEEKEEQMDAKNSSTSPGTSSVDCGIGNLCHRRHIFILTYHILGLL